MRHRAALAGAVVSLVVGAWAASASPQTSKATTHKKTTSYHHSARTTTAAKATAAKTAPKTAVSASKSKSTTSKSTAKRRAPVVAHHYTPQQPTPERYKEIQQALATRGYFNGEPDGNWGPSSVDALRRFQHDQNLVEDGKIGSLAIIALGLGPKRDTPEQPQKAVETEQKIP